jgi:hypothetical protein
MPHRTADADDLNRLAWFKDAPTRPKRIGFGWVLALDLVLWLGVAEAWFRFI